MKNVDYCHGFDSFPALYTLYNTLININNTLDLHVYIVETFLVVDLCVVNIMLNQYISQFIIMYRHNSLYIIL